VGHSPRSGEQSILACDYGAGNGYEQDGGEDLQLDYGCFLFSFFSFFPSLAIGFGK
jgi:hypothetical protein